MLYRPPLNWIVKNVDNHPFTIKRWIRLPIRAMDSGYMRRPGALTESTVRPMIAEHDLKPGFYWPELIH